MSNPAGQISTQLRQTKGLHIRDEWLLTFLSCQRPATPTPALIQTALFRILSSDIRPTLQANQDTCLPASIGDVTCREKTTTSSIVVQVLSVEDLSKSRWEQIEAIEAFERGEQKKGREIIRAIDTADSDEHPGSVSRAHRAAHGGPHKLLLQDAAGTQVWAVEMSPIEGINMSMSIGAKLVVRKAVVARGVVLLDNANCAFLGGKIEELHGAWKEKRKEELRSQIQASRAGNN